MQRRMRFESCRIFACALIVVLVIGGAGAIRLAGQAATASIQGTVNDQSGAAVPGAEVQVKNTGTGATQTITSNATGRYNVADLPVGKYEHAGGQDGLLDRGSSRQSL